MVTTLVVLCVSAYLCWYANRAYQRTGDARAKLKRVRWAGAFGGAAAGSYVGVAALGSAMSGTIPGALLGYLLVAQLMRAFASGETGTLERAALHDVGRGAAHVARQAVEGAAGLGDGLGARLKSIAYTALKWLMLVGFILVLVNVNWHVVFGGNRETPYSVDPGVTQNAAPVEAVPSMNNASMTGAPAPTLATRAAVNATPYDQLVRELELAHPELDPTNQRYDHAAVTQIVAMAKSGEAQGMEATAALRLAARNYYNYAAERAAGR